MERATHPADLSSELRPPPHLGSPSPSGSSPGKIAVVGALLQMFNTVWCIVSTAVIVNPMSSS
eukprot:1742459-Rhodomonas_salina.1